MDGKIQPQTYVFMPGRHLAGNTRDRSLERFSFRALAARLAHDLRRQDFHPARSFKEADLLLVVHWGATTGNSRNTIALSQGFDALASLGSQAEESREQLNQAIEAGDFQRAEALRGDLDQLASSARQERQALLYEDRNVGATDTAKLLGFAAEMSRDDGTLSEQERRKTLSDLTREDCYFVVVMAYDARALVESKRLNWVWSLRVSMSTAGVNFPEAVDRISQVAGRHFGSPADGVDFSYPKKREREGTVRLEEIVVLGTDEP